MADIDPAHKGDRVVDDHDLAMVAMVDIEQTGDASPRADGIELAHRDAFGFELLEERVIHFEAAHAVVEHAHAHTCTSALDEQIAERFTRPLALEDVAFDIDRTLGSPDRIEHGVVGGRTVNQQPGGVVVGQGVAAMSHPLAVILEQDKAFVHLGATRKGPDRFEHCLIHGKLIPCDDI